MNCFGAGFSRSAAEPLVAALFGGTAGCRCAPCEERTPLGKMLGGKKKKKKSVLAFLLKFAAWRTIYKPVYYVGTAFPPRLYQ